MADFKFGAKLKLFGEHDVTIRPNREFPWRVEYHDATGIGVTRDLLVDKLNIENEDIQKMIPDNTRITDLVFDKNTTEFEVGIVIEPGEDFVLNKYDDILTVDEVSLFYKYDPTGKGKTEQVEIDEELPAEDDSSEGVFASVENTVEDLGDAAEDMMDEAEDVIDDMEDDLEGLG